MSPRSLRSRFSLLAVFVAGVLVTVLGSAFVLVLQVRLEKSAHDELRNRVEAASDLVALAPGGNLILVGAASGQVLDEGAWVFQGSRTVARAPGPPALQRAVAALSGQSGFRGGPGGVLLLAQAFPDSGARSGTVVGVLSLERNAQAVDLVQELVVGIGLLTMIGTWFATRLLVGRALRPVVALTRQAAAWSATDVGRRFGKGRRPTELAELAETLDGVLDRLSAVLRHEQQLTAELSHELRTPLARIVAEVELLQVRPRSTSELDTAHRSIAAGASRMDRILSTLLSTARSRADVAPGRTETAGVLREVCASYADPRLHVVGAPVVVGVDAAVLERIVGPLVENALRYARTSVQLRTGPGPVVVVEDDGPGLAADLRESMFDPGRRATPQDGHRGAGLGLALCRRLARAAGGDVVLGARDGGGLTATVTLPGG
ncbi:MAG: histidine kinase [Frankiales bacterium]|nr:histidine kinase [Frankiales bacterium]